MNEEKKNSIGLNELVDYQKKSYGPIMGGIMRFLWKCGGADAQILQYAPYSDHIKNAGIGGVVLATSVMASVAMGFATHTIFGDYDATGGHHGNWAITVPVAVIWGLIIFNLDRFIVSTVKGDGTEKITREELVSMLPRLVMAVIIALTISAPLETYIFRDEIRREWKISVEEMAVAKTYEVEQTEQQFREQLEAQLKEKRIQVATQQAAFDKANDEANNNLQGRGNAIAGKGPEYEELQKKALAEKTTLEALRNELALKERENEENKLRIQQRKNDVLAEYAELKPGFLDQLMMLERLASEGKQVPMPDPANGGLAKDENGDVIYKEIHGSASGPIWLVRLLFMIVEIAPVIFKFMIWKSSYDYMQDNVAQILEAKQGISLEIITDENNNVHRVKENYNARRIVEVSKRQNELEKENAIHAITMYAEKERGEMERNPEKFIQPVDPPKDEA